MEYTQKLTKIGNSMGIILPKALLDSLNLALGNELHIGTVQEKIIIEKERSSNISPEFLKVAEDIANKYAPAFRELASK